MLLSHITLTYLDTECIHCSPNHLHWTSHGNEVLLTRMEPTNKKDKVTVVAIGDKYSVVGHLMKGKDGRFAKTVSYFYGQASIMVVQFMSHVKLSIKEMIRE